MEIRKLFFETNFFQKYIIFQNPTKNTSFFFLFILTKKNMNTSLTHLDYTTLAQNEIKDSYYSFKIGKKLGNGRWGQIYEITNITNLSKQSKPSKYVIKIIPLNTYLLNKEDHIEEDYIEAKENCIPITTEKEFQEEALLTSKMSKIEVGPTCLSTFITCTPLQFQFTQEVDSLCKKYLKEKELFFTCGCIIMEKLDSNLQEYCQLIKNHPHKEEYMEMIRKTVIEQSLKVLETEKIIHADLFSGENIVLNIEKESYKPLEVKLIDWGIVSTVNEFVTNHISRTCTEIFIRNKVLV